jgi:hypothetical protein
MTLPFPQVPASQYIRVAFVNFLCYLLLLFSWWKAPSLFCHATLLIICLIYQILFSQSTLVHYYTATVSIFQIVKFSGPTWLTFSVAIMKICDYLICLSKSILTCSFPQLLPQPFLEIIRNHIPFQLHPRWSQKAHLGYWILTRQKMASSVYHAGCWQLRRAWAAEEVPGQMIHQKWLPHDITISPITLARGANQKQVPHDITVQLSWPDFPNRTTFLMTTQSFQLPWNTGKS